MMAISRIHRQSTDGSINTKSAPSRDYIEILSSPKILNSASAKCGVDPNLIKSSLQVVARRGTDFIEVTAFHDNLATAEKIIIAVVETFAANESAHERARADRALEALDGELETHGELVTQRKGAIDDFLKLHGPLFGKKDLLYDSQQQRDYNSRKDEYEQARELLRQMKIQQQEQRVLLKMPRTPITIHQAAITKRR